MFLGCVPVFRGSCFLDVLVFHCSCFQMFLFSMMFLFSIVPVFRCSCFPLFLFPDVPFSVFLFSDVAVFHCSCFQIFRFSDVPVFRCSCVQLYLFSDVPFFHMFLFPLCSFFIPVFKCSCFSVPVFRCSRFPLFLFSIIPVFRCSYFPLFLFLCSCCQNAEARRSRLCWLVLKRLNRGVTSGRRPGIVWSIATFRYALTIWDRTETPGIPRLVP